MKLPHEKAAQIEHSEVTQYTEEKQNKKKEHINRTSHLPCDLKVYYTTHKVNKRSLK